MMRSRELQAADCLRTDSSLQSAGDAAILSTSNHSLPERPDVTHMQERNARIGLWLFGLYLLLYGGFVLLNAFWPATMDLMPLWGLNLAITWGFGLIVAAVVLALVYGFLCRAAAPGDPQDERRR